MSFNWAHFGTGFQAKEPWPSRRFRRRAQEEGRLIAIIKLTEIGEDEYGAPQFTETTSTVQGFLTPSGHERQVQAGDLKLGRLKVLLPLNTLVGESGFELSYQGRRYGIVSLERRRAYIEIQAERKAQ